jgi:glycosyltransferase involved in cell wall biosynthesis
MLKYLYELPRLAGMIETMVRERKINLLYVNGPRFLPSAAWAARRASVPVVFHCHNRLLQNAAIQLAGQSLRLSRAQVIACCRFAAEPLLRYVSGERISILYNGVRELQRAPSAPSNKLRRIGVVGRIEPEKGQVEFVQAARIVAREFPDCEFFVIGAPMFSNDDYYNQVVGASQDLPVQFLGWQNDLSKVFSGLDMLVVPSTFLDATPRVILEAFTAGVPVVAFPSGGIPEIVRDGETGFLAANFTSEALAARILSVLKMSPSAISAVIAEAQKAWRERYALNRFQQAVSEAVALIGASPNREKQ